MVLMLPISAAITASTTVSPRGAENEAASRGVAAIQAIGHHGWRLIAIAIMTPEPMAAIRRWRVVSNEEIINELTVNE